VTALRSSPFSRSASFGTCALCSLTSTVPPAVAREILPSAPPTPVDRCVRPGLAGHACYDPGVASVALTVEFTLRVVLYPAPDVEGQWIAHGLETDVVTQGDSPEHALAMMADALQALASHQAVRRRPTLQLRPAPAEVWDLAADAVPLDLTAHVDRRRRGAASPSGGPWGLYGLVSQKPPASRAR